MNFDDMKNINEIQDVNDFMKAIENNPNLIDRLSKERIDILTNVYIEKIQKNDEKIEELKAKLNKK